MNLLTDRIVHEAAKHIGVKEVGRNDGPEVREWLRRVNRFPPAPWCAAFAWCMLDDACKALGIRHPIEPVAGVHLFAQLAKEKHAWTDVPGPGFIFFIDHGRDAHGYRLGHCGIVIELHANGTLSTIEGNTNEAGGREGDCVAVKTRMESEITLGYLDPGKLAIEHEHGKDQS